MKPGIARSLFFFAKIGLLIAAAIWIAERPGKVSFEWLGYRIETSVGLLLAAILLLMVLAALLYRFWGWIWTGPGRLREAREQKQRLKGYRALTQGMVAVAAGDAEEAKRQARTAHGLLPEPPLTLLLAAQAAQLSGDETAAKRYFTAMLQRPETSFLGLRGLLNQAIAKGDRAEALQLARRAAKERPDARWAAKAVVELELQEGDWNAARQSLRQAEKTKALPAGDAKRAAAIAFLAQARETRDAAAVQEALRHLPDFVPAISTAAEIAIAGNRAREAEKAIEKAWARGLAHPDLAAAYAAAHPSESPLDRARRFEKLAALAPGHDESRLALAETALAAGLWGNARQALEPMIAAARSHGEAVGARVARAMARLEEGERSDLVAARRWYALAMEAVPDPAWHCGACGHAHGAWGPRCDNCGAVDRMVWRASSRAPQARLGSDSSQLPALSGAPKTGAGGKASFPPTQAPTQAVGQTKADGLETAPSPVDAARRIG